MTVPLQKRTLTKKEESRALQGWLVTGPQESGRPALPLGPSPYPLPLLHNYSLSEPWFPCLQNGDDTSVIIVRIEDD